MSRKPFSTRKLRFEPLERRELLAVNIDTHGGDVIIHVDGGETIDIGWEQGHASPLWVDTDGDNSDGDATQYALTRDLKILLVDSGATVNLKSDQVDTNQLVNTRMNLPGDLTIEGSSGTDTITFSDVDALGGAQIGGTFTFTGQGGGDSLTIQVPGDLTKPTEVGWEVDINTGPDLWVDDSIEIHNLDITAPPGGRCYLTISTGEGNDTVELDKVSVGGIDNETRVQTGAGDDEITITEFDGGPLVILSDGGAHSPGGNDTITLDDVNLGGKNLTVQTGKGDDTVDLVDNIVTTGSALISLGTGVDDLDVGTAVGATVQARRLKIGGGGGVDAVNVGNIATTKSLIIDLGTGADDLDVGSFAGASVQAKSVYIRGKGGADTIDVHNLTATAKLGIRTHDGADVLTIGDALGPVDARSLIVCMGAGNDTFNIGSQITLPGANAFRARGGPDSDVINGQGNLPMDYWIRIQKFETRNA